jgi:hypothetical protein
LLACICGLLAGIGFSVQRSGTVHSDQVFSPQAKSMGYWASVAPGVEARTITVPDASDAPPVPIIAMRTMPSHMAIAAGAILDAATWANHENVTAAVNGGFFDPQQRPVGLIVARSKILSHISPAHGGVFFMIGRRARILPAPEFLRQHPACRGITLAIQCAPLLSSKGQVSRLKVQIARRTGIGVQADGHVVIAVSDTPLSLKAWANVWVDTAGLNCPDALNLDGGPSTQLCIRAGHHTLSIPGGWPVPDAVLIR